MVDRKMYSRSRQKELLNRVVDEELYKPDDFRSPHGADRGIADLLMRQRIHRQTAHPRHRLSDLMGEGVAVKAPMDAPPRPAGFWARLRRRLASLLSSFRS